MENPCECCEEAEAIRRVTLTDLDGEVKDVLKLCKDCLNGPWCFDDDNITLPSLG